MGKLRYGSVSMRIPPREKKRMLKQTYKREQARLRKKKDEGKAVCEMERLLPDPYTEIVGHPRSGQPTNGFVT